MTTPTPAPRIRWEPNDDGSHVTPAHEGYVGTIGEPQFFIFEPDDRDPWWIMTSSLPGLPSAGQSERRAHGDDTDGLKAEAEHWLSEFVASLGAIFPAPAFEFDDDDGEPLGVMYAPGRRVRYVHPDWGYPGEQEPAAELLVLGAAYTIAQHSIGQSRTDLILEGIPGEWFNSVLFEPADDEKADRTAPAALVCESCSEPVERTFDDDYQHTTTQAGVSCTVYPVVAVRPDRTEGGR